MIQREIGWRKTVPGGQPHRQGGVAGQSDGLRCREFYAYHSVAVRICGAMGREAAPEGHAGMNSRRYRAGRRAGMNSRRYVEGSPADSRWVGGGGWVGRCAAEGVAPE